MSRLKKADYIAKYGEEAWDIESARRSKHTKRWRQGNKDHIAEYNKQYREDNKEYLAEYNKQYYNTNKEYFAERQKHREGEKERVKQYRGTQRGRAICIKRNYNNDDKNRGFSTGQNINCDWIIKNIFTSKCIYCGDDDWTHLGADRIDNSKPHTPDNCVCACGLCNMARGDRFSVEEFKEYRRTHPRKLGGGIEKSWEIVEQNGIRVIKKKLG